ncbi:EamA family transporter [Candidatus Acidulodesulfobacterium sp. H_13]|uniref:EamA family transporter n=1 Tax=Candidatus Acidulodesulfobacterium sp. H_13 TaxID=3395470 RepID=UPI003AF7F808
MDMISYVFMGLAVIFNSIGQILQKVGSGRIKKEHLKIGVKSIFVFFNPFIFSALVMLLFATIFYLFALSMLPLSIAYPMLSSGYIIVVLLSKIFLNEKVNLKRWVGVFVIIIGIFIIFNSGK